MKSLPPPRIWVITEGMTGTENQCLGITDALGVSPHVYRIGLRQPWKLLSPYLGWECAASFTPALPAPPWPDILITSGRKSIAASRYIKKQSQGRTLTVQIQDPRISPKNFDVVVVPRHDPTRGENVFVSVATPNRITTERLAAAKVDFEPLFGQTSDHPRVAVLIGGSTKRHVFTEADTQNLITALAPIPHMMITTSRRTGDANTHMIRNAFGASHYIWDGVSPNPYMGMLAWADIILVTADSTSMISEAATTGKPVYVLPMAGLTPRQAQLVANLKDYGAVRDYPMRDVSPPTALQSWSYPPLHDAQDIAGKIIALYHARKTALDAD